MNTSKSTTNASSQTTPWKPQSDALNFAFNQAKTAYGTASNATAPTDFTAQMTPDQLSVFSKMLGTGGTNLATANGLVDTGANGASAALSGLIGIDPAASNNMAANIAGGMAYASGADIPAAVRNAMAGATENARDVLIPGIDSNAAGTGNTNSSRTGLAEGLVARDLANRSADLAGSMYNDLYNTGANLTSTTNSGNIGALTQALAAAMGGGTNLYNAGNEGTGNAFNMMTTGAAGPQQAQQLALQNALQKYQSGVSAPFDALDNYYKIIGANNWGQNTNSTSTTTATPSTMQTIGQLTGAAGSLIGSPAGAFGGGSGLLGMSPTLFGLLPK